MANSLQKGRYTKYSNKIGLYSNTKGSFIKNDTDVVLNFPFKDTVLEGGMSKEDVGRDERFLHIELDSKDIDTLEEPKVFTDFSYIDKDGEKALTKDSDIEFFDEEGELKQNLLIKGNNLLALYTLREKLAGKVKLIYIDPPYNTGNDGFKYNDNFNHSTWLTFMKNRLEVARDLLRDDGVIFVQCDDNEQAYLKVLMDEVFGRENFVATIIWRKKRGGGRGNSIVIPQTEYIISFSLKIIKLKPFLKEISEYKIKDFKFEDIFGKYKREGLDHHSPFGAYERKTLQYSLIFENEEVYCPSGQWLWSQDRVSEELKNYETVKGIKIFKYLDFIKDRQGRMRVYKKIRLDEHGQERKETLISIIDEKSITNNVATNEISKLFGRDKFSYPKPEELLKILIEVSTKEGDIVLDYHLGSGTTSAVAHKMGRRWIGVEQMDYIEDIAKERLKKVIAGEQGGISKSVNWQGGGSFVYLELKKYNQEYVDLITKATSLSELEEIYVEMRNNAFLKFWFDRKDFEKDENFRKLDLVERKKVLIDVLDENQLYLNYPDMNDARHNVTEDEKALTDKFYGSDKD